MKMSDDGEMISGRVVLEDHWQYECVDGGEGGFVVGRSVVIGFNGKDS
jgi:hypothetical protein